MNPIDLHDIYARHRQALFSLALSVTGCPARAEDAVHEAFARLCRLRGEPGHGVADPVAYAFLMVRNAAVDQVRRHRRVERAADRTGDAAASLFDPDAAGPEAQALEAERRRLIAEAIDRLPADQREAVVLRALAGLSFAQMSAVLGAPAATLVTRYHRALKRLKQRLEKLV